MCMKNINSLVVILFIALFLFTGMPNGGSKSFYLQGIYAETNEEESEDGVDGIGIQITDDLSSDDLSEDEGIVNTEKDYRLFGFVRNMLHVMGSGTEEEWMSSHYTLRLGIEIKKGNLKSELSTDTDLIFSNYMQQSQFDYYWRSLPRNRLFQFEKSSTSREYLLRENVHRASIAYESDQFHLIFGRFANSWGQSRLFNPLDLVTPMGPFLYDTEDLPGADGMVLRYFTGSFNFFELAVNPYRRLNQSELDSLQAEDVNILLRHKITLDNTDVFYTGGQHFHSYVGGLDLNSTFWDASWRAAYLFRYHKAENYMGTDTFTGSLVESKTEQVQAHSAIVGFGYAFFKKLRTNIELFYNGMNIKDYPHLEAILYSESYFPGSSDQDIAYFSTTGRIITYYPWYGSMSLGYNINPLLSAEVILLYDIEGGSAFVSPSLTYSISDNAESVFSYRQPVDFGQKDKNDYGSYEPEGFILVRLYF